MEFASADDAVERTATYSRDVSDSAPAIDSAARRPIITILSESPAKISKIAAFDTATVVWVSDGDLDMWEFRVVPSPPSPHSAGTVIPTDAGSTTQGGAVAALIPVTSEVKGTDLETAVGGPGHDGAYEVKVFGRGLDGVWSD